MFPVSWSGLINNVVQIGLTVSAAALVLFLLRRVMKKRYPARAICFVWALLAIRLLIPVQLTLPDAPVQVTPIRAVTVDMSPREEMQSTAQAAAADETRTPRVSVYRGDEMWHEVPVGWNFPVAKMMFILWGAGILAFLGWQAYSYIGFVYLARETGQAAERDTLRRVFEDQKQSLGIRRDIPLVVTPAADCPMLAGFLRPALYLPDEALSEQEAMFVFRHELTHLKRGDLWLKLLLTAARAVHWFNPLVYLMARFAQEDIELACDDAVVRGMDGAARRAYGETILKSATAQVKKRALVSCFTGDKKTLMRRFEGIFDKRVKKRGVALILSAAVLVGTLGCAVSVGESKDSLTEELRIQLAEQWAQSGNPKYGYTVKLDGDNTYALFDHTNTVMWDDAVIESVPHRLCWQLSFEKGEDGWQVSDAERIAENGVTSLDEFRLLYENDLGFPDFLMVDWSDPLMDISTPDKAAVNLLYLRGNISVREGIQEDICDVSVTFADGSEVTITMVNQFGEGWLPQDFTYPSQPHVRNAGREDAINDRTAADLAQQYARGVVHKSGQYIYPILSAAMQQDFVTQQGTADGGMNWRYGGASPSYRDYALSQTSGGDYIAVFQMYGGGMDDYREAYLVETGSADGRSVIQDVRKVERGSNRTDSELFRLYYDSGLAWPSIPEGATNFNGASLDTLTRVRDAAETVFSYLGTPVEHVEGDLHSFTMESWFTSEVLSQADTDAVVRLSFTDGSPSVDVQMQKTGDYWLPVGFAGQADDSFRALIDTIPLPSGTTVEEAIRNADGNIPVLELGTEIQLEPMGGKGTNLYGVLNDSIITADGTKRLVESESEMYNIPFADENRSYSIYTVARHPSEVLLSTYGETVYRAVELTYHIGDDRTMYHAVFVYGIATDRSVQPDYTITSTTYHNDTYGYTLTLPECFVDRGYLQEMEENVRFGMKNAWPSEFTDPFVGGTVMTLCIEATAYLQDSFGEDWVRGHLVPCVELAEHNGLTYYLAFASDVQYDPADAEITAQYGEMRQAAESMGGSAISFDGQTNAQHENEQELLLRDLSYSYAYRQSGTGEGPYTDQITVVPDVADHSALVTIRFTNWQGDYYFTTVERVRYDRTDTVTPSHTETLLNTSDGVRSLEQFILAFPLEQELPYFEGQGLESLSDMASRPASQDNPDLSTPQACAAYALHLVAGEWAGADDTQPEETTWCTYQWEDGFVQITLQRVQLTDDSPVLWLPIGWRTEESGIGFVGQWPHYYSVLAHMPDYYSARDTDDLLWYLDMGWADGAYAEGILSELDRRWELDPAAVEDAVMQAGTQAQTLWLTHRGDIEPRFSEDEIEAAYQAVRDYAAENGFSVENLRYDTVTDWSQSQVILRNGVLQDNAQQDGLTIDDVITVVGDAQFGEDAWRESAEGWSFTLYRGTDGRWVLEDGAFGY